MREHWTVIPMTGKGHRFDQSHPGIWKPLIPVIRELTILDLTLQNLPLHDKVVLIVPGSKVELVSAQMAGRDYFVDIFISDRTGKGPADTMLELENIIPPGAMVTVANCDQYVEWDVQRWLELLNDDWNVIATELQDLRWSYAQTDNCGNVTVRVKDSFDVSKVVGIYGFTRADEMFNLIHVALLTPRYHHRGELFMCPLFNLMPFASTMVMDVDKFVPLGDPESVQAYKVKASQ